MDNKRLTGKHLVSFQIELDASDNFSFGDIVQCIADGFNSDATLVKIAKLHVEPLDVKGEPIKLSAGDEVTIKENIKLTATILNNDGYYTVGKKEVGTKVIGENVPITLLRGCKALINKMVGDTVELIDLDSSVAVPLTDPDTNEISDVPVNIDFVTVDKSLVAKVREVA